MPSQISKSKPKLSFEAIGTQWTIETVAQVDDIVRKIIMRRIEEFDLTYSRFRDDSLVNEIAGKAGEYDFPADAEKLASLYYELYKATDGAVSPLVGNALVEAGYDKSYSLQPGVIHTVPAWDEIMRWNGAHVSVRQPATLDFGAAGKGHLVDLIGEILERNGHAAYTIDASGDVRTRGAPEVIGLENPHDAESVIGTMRIENASLCASASNRRAWGKWHHIIDPRTGEPARDVVATWVMAANTLEADGLATALFFVHADNLKSWDFQYVRLMADGRIEHSPGFVGELFL